MGFRPVTSSIFSCYLHGSYLRGKCTAHLTDQVLQYIMLFLVNLRTLCTCPYHTTLGELVNLKDLLV
jgi:hypothetical protein